MPKGCEVPQIKYLDTMLESEIFLTLINQFIKYLLINISIFEKKILIWSEVKHFIEIFKIIYLSLDYCRKKIYGVSKCIIEISER